MAPVSSADDTARHKSPPPPLSTTPSLNNAMFTEVTATNKMDTEIQASGFIHN